jgi:hypothetical protein
MGRFSLFRAPPTIDLLWMSSEACIAAEATEHAMNASIEQ